MAVVNVGKIGVYRAVSFGEIVGSVVVVGCGVRVDGVSGLVEVLETGELL